jgi:CRISPR system Cascade subunit CasE
MFLSRLTLNPRSAQVRREVARPYEMHRTLLRAFAQGTVGVSRHADTAAGVLFRVDELLRESAIAVLVQSKTAPDWAYLTAVRDARGQSYLLKAAESKAVDLHLSPGQTLAFRLRANPTKRLGKSAAHDKGKRVGIYEQEKQLEWLQRKGEAGGFRILRGAVSRGEYIENKDAIHRQDQAHDLKMLSVQFDGILQVLDPAQVLRSMEAGIGSGKGFGFGLLSLAPA